MSTHIWKYLMMNLPIVGILLNRIIWAKLESLPQAKYELLLDRFLEEPYLLRASSSQFERLFELSSKSYSNIEFCELLKKLARQSVHNAYHYAVLSFAKKIKNCDLEIY